MDGYVVSTERVIPAPAEVIFDLVADPARHPDIDGSGSVKQAKDGVPRRLFDQGGEVLIGGVRRPLAGAVTMDQIIIDCGPSGSAPVAVGDEVVLIGRQGDEVVTADEWAELLGTIPYEVLCDIGPRVPRLMRGEGSDPTD